MRARWPTACLCLALSTLAAIAAGQQPPAQQTPPIFRAATTVVEVDVIVKDGAGRFVADLRPEEFEVLDAGQPQRIEALYLVRGSTVIPSPATPAAAAGDERLPPPRPQRVIVLFFDVDHIAPGGMDRAKKAAETFIAKSFEAGDVGGVVAGGAMVNGRLTSDAKELQAAVRGLRAESASVVASRDLRTWPRFLDLTEAWQVVRNQRAPDGRGTVLDRVVTRACMERPDDCGRGGASVVESEVQSKATLLVNQERVSAQRSFKAMGALANGLARLPGRKTVVLFTDGFLGEESWADLRQVVGLSARGNVRFYSIDTRGLNRGSGSSDILSSEAPSRDYLASPSGGDEVADVPNSLAVDTGGLVIRNENDFGKALAEVASDTSSYYVLGYRPSNPPSDARFRSLTVRVTRGGVSVRARKGYLPSVSASPAPAAPPSAAPPAQPATPPGGEPPGAAPVVPPGAATPVVVGGGSEAAGGVRLRPDVHAQVSKLESGARPPAGTYPPELRQRARAGWEAYQRGDVSAARASLSPAANHPATPPWVCYALGWSLYAEGNHAAAGEQWERVREAAPAFEPVYLDLADAYVQQKEFGRAVGVLRDGEKRFPQSVEMYNALGVIQAARGAINDAIQTFEKGVSVDPADETACYNLAKTLELRYVQGERERRASSMASSQTALTDRERALQYYRMVAVMKGRFADEAADGVRRLTGK